MSEQTAAKLRRARTEIRGLKNRIELLERELEAAQAIADAHALVTVESHGAPIERDGFGWWDLTEEQQLSDFTPELAYLEGRGLIERDSTNALLVRITPD